MKQSVGLSLFFLSELGTHPSWRRSSQESHGVKRRVYIVEWGVGLIADGGGGMDHLYSSHS